MAKKIEHSNIISGGGEMGERIRAFDWAQTTLGAIEDWQPSLRTAVQIMLNSRFAMFIWWGDDLTYFYNDAYAPTLGARHLQALGASAKEIWSEIWDDVAPQVDAVTKCGEATWNVELLLFLERGGFTEETYHTFSYSPIYAEDNQVGGLFCAVSEETANVLSRRRLQTLRELGTRTLDESQTAETACCAAVGVLAENPFDLPFALIYLLDKTGKRAVLCENLRFECQDNFCPEVIELETESADVWNFRGVLEAGECLTVDDLPDKFGAIGGGAWADDVTTRAKVLLLAKSGQETPAGFLICGISPRLVFDDDYRGFLELVAAQLATAISNARAREEDRRRAEALAEIDRAKTEFFSNVSHEFRTPLTLMLGNLESVLAKNDALPPTEKRALETAQRNSLRLLKLVNNLLDFSRLEAGRINAVYEPTDLCRMTSELASNFQSAVERTAIKYTVDCDLISKDVLVDREMWEKIVLNLISNAFKFTFTGEIKITLRETKTSVVLKVSDTGTGISDAEQTQIFERFHRIRGAQSRTHEGTGIGLSLVKELVGLHGGEISVESEPEKGSIFTVKILKGDAHLPPDRIGAARELNHASNRAAAFVNEVSFHDTNADFDAENALLETFGTPPDSATGEAAFVLLADDNRDMRVYVSRLLEQAGHRVKTFADGAATLEFIEKSAAENDLPDLILTDVMMPRLDGFGLLAAIRKDEKTGEIPVIILSARAGEESRIEGLDKGADDYLVKPFSSKELLARIESNLKINRLRRESNQQIRNILESFTDGFFALDREWRFIYVNKQGEKILDRESGELLGKVIWDVYQIAGTAFETAYRRTAETGETSTLTAYYPDHKRWYEANSYAAPDGIVVYFRNATKRIEAENILRESEEKFRDLANSISQFAWMADASGYIFWYNERWFDYTGTTLEEMQGWGWQTVHHPQELERVTEKFKRHLAAGEIWEDTFPLRSHSGEYRWFLSRAVPIKDEQGRILRWFGTNTDIEEVRQARLQAEQSNRLKDEFLATVSHELRTPLNAIIGWAQMMTTGKATGEIAVRASETIYRSAKAQAQLIEDLLDVSRIITGKLRLEAHPVALEDVVGNAVETLRPAIDAKKIKLKKVFGSSEPIIGDANRLQQIVWNLLSNAVKFTPENKTIRVEIEQTDGFAQLTVSDEGIGIEAGVLPFVFERFRQADGSTTRQHGGLGLGLAIVRHLVELHGGTISAASAGLDEGATFVVRLPLFGSSNAADDAPPKEILPVSELSETSVETEEFPAIVNLRVLIVDDEPTLLELLELALAQSGAVVKSAASADAALEIFKDWKPDLLISDIAMPQRDGFWLIKRVRELTAEQNDKIPVIALTAYARAEDRDRILAAGFQMFLAKPIEPDELLRAVAELTGREME